MAAGLDPKRWQEAKRILDEALDRPGPERAEYIARACGGDETLRREVESLSRAAAAEWSLVDDGALAGPAPFPEERLRSRIGERIGAYEILSELGHGGMGTVFLARRADDEFQKRVAIKLIRFGMASESELRRFRSERQISAALDHPNIARLLDGGTTTDGEPYFVMEHVEGETLLEFSDARRLSIRTRLELFREVCAAVQYAHQNLVVHRDIKPSNILVTAEGVPKLLDFGIAKLLDPGEGETAGQTGTLLLMMTPEYASPEQVRGRKVSTASDVYSLGVVLYELVSGQKPYRIETNDPQELVSVVCERDPARPSTHGSGISPDLDAIVLKAIRKEPERRYPSVEALSADIGRYLDGRPVQARRGTATYRIGKFVRRHRVGVAAAAIVLVALAGGVWATLAEARRARAAEARAEKRFNDVRKLANSFLFEFHDAIRDLPGATPARALLVRRALDYLDDLARESAGDRSLVRELAEAYQKVGDVQGNPYQANLGDVKGALDSYRKAVALLEPVVRSGHPTASEQATLAGAYLIGGGIQLVAGDPKAAVGMSEKGLALQRELSEREPGDAKRQMDLARAWQFHGFNLSAARRGAEASRAYEVQASILRARLKADPSDRAAQRGLGQNLYLSGQQLESLGDLDRALAAFQESVRIQEDLLAAQPSSVQLQRDVIWVRTSLGNHFVLRKDFRTAIQEYERTLELSRAMAAADPQNTDPRLTMAMSLHNLGEAVVRSGELSEALARFAEAKRLYEANFAPGSANTYAAGMLAALYVDAADSLEAARQKSAVVKPDVLRALGSPCDLYRRSVAAFERLQAVRQLEPDKEDEFAHARSALGRCGSR